MTGNATAVNWGRAVPAGLAAGIGLLAALHFVSVATSEFARIYGGQDLVGYLAGTRRFLETGSPYLPEQVAGPWRLEAHSFIHPPAALPLFLPFLVLPAVLWWLIPLATVAVAVWQMRPAPWTWPVVALCLAWPRTAGGIVAGNTDMWACAAVALGCLHGWPFAALVAKPTFAPLAIVAAGRPSLWIGGLVALALSAVAGPLWVQYGRVISNASLGPEYSLLNLPFVAAPIVAYLGSSRRRFRWPLRQQPNPGNLATLRR